MTRLRRATVSRLFSGKLISFKISHGEKTSFAHSQPDTIFPSYVKVSSLAVLVLYLSAIVLASLVSVKGDHNVRGLLWTVD
jgi:hypothetical protein